jgi:DNA-binding response OmpR family regulator
MPLKNGLECLKEIRNNEKFKEILIAIYSTSGAEKDFMKHLLTETNVYLKKPNNFELLKNC